MRRYSHLRCAVVFFCTDFFDPCPVDWRLSKRRTPATTSAAVVRPTTTATTGLDETEPDETLAATLATETALEPRLLELMNLATELGYFIQKNSVLELDLGLN